MYTKRITQKQKIKKKPLLFFNLSSKERALSVFCAVLIFFPFLLFAKPIDRKKPAGSLLFLGDYYYLKKDYLPAQIEYERALRSASLKQSQTDLMQSKLLLSLLRQNKFAETVERAKNQKKFQHLYISMFAALRLGWIPLALRQQGSILSSREITAEQKEQALLLGGSIYLEQKKYKKAESFYAKLQKESKNQGNRKKIGSLLSALQRHQKSKATKSLWAAGIFAAILPGSGHVYAEHYADGLTAFFFNAVFIGSAFLFYDLERRADSSHYASVAMGLIGINFYAANIGGGIQSARRYNNFKTRVFHQELRDSFFNTADAENASGVRFEKKQP